MSCQVRMRPPCGSQGMFMYKIKNAQLQGIEYEYNLFSVTELVVLASLVGREQHGQTELYRMLVASVSDLESTVNRKAILKQKRDEKTAQVSALRAQVESLTSQMTSLADEIHDINMDLARIELREIEQRGTVIWAQNKGCRGV